MALVAREAFGLQLGFACDGEPSAPARLEIEKANRIRAVYSELTLRFAVTDKSFESARSLLHSELKSEQVKAIHSLAYESSVNKTRFGELDFSDFPVAFRNKVERLSNRIAWFSDNMRRELLHVSFIVEMLILNDRLVASEHKHSIDGREAWSSRVKTFGGVIEWIRLTEIIGDMLLFVRQEGVDVTDVDYLFDSSSRLLKSAEARSQQHGETVAVLGVKQRETVNRLLSQYEILMDSYEIWRMAIDDTDPINTDPVNNFKKWLNRLTPSENQERLNEKKAAHSTDVNACGKKVSAYAKFEAVIDSMDWSEIDESSRLNFKKLRECSRKSAAEAESQFRLGRSTVSELASRLTFRSTPLTISEDDMETIGECDMKIIVSYIHLGKSSDQDWTLVSKMDDFREAANGFFSKYGISVSDTEGSVARARKRRLHAIERSRLAEETQGKVATKRSTKAGESDVRLGDVKPAIPSGFSESEWTALAAAWERRVGSKARSSPRSTGCRI